MKTGFKRLFSVLLLFPLLLAVSCAASSKAVNIDKVKEQYLTGCRKLESGNFKDAEAAFLAVLEQGGKTAYGHTGMAMLEADRGNHRQAAMHVKKALRLDSEFPDAWIAKGHALAKRGGDDDWFSEASEAFDKALELTPGDERTLFYYAESALVAGKFDIASELYVSIAIKKEQLAGRARARSVLATLLMDAQPVRQSCIDIGLDDTVDRADLAVLLVEQFEIIEFVGKHRSDLYRELYRKNGPYRVNRSKIRKETDDERARECIYAVVQLRLAGLSQFPNGFFYPDRVVTRAQFASLVQSIAAIIGHDESLTTRFIGSDTPFSDVRNDYYAYNAIRFCVENGLLSTISRTDEFDPGGTVSGAEALVTLRRLANMLEKNEEKSTAVNR